MSEGDFHTTSIIRLTSPRIIPRTVPRMVRYWYFSECNYSEYGVLAEDQGQGSLAHSNLRTEYGALRCKSRSITKIIFKKLKELLVYNSKYRKSLLSKLENN